MYLSGGQDSFVKQRGCYFSGNFKTTITFHLPDGINFIDQFEFAIRDRQSEKLLQQKIDGNRNFFKFRTGGTRSASLRQAGKITIVKVKG